MRIKRYFLKFLFNRKSYLIRSSRYVKGNYDLRSKKIEAIFHVVVYIDQFFRSDYADYVIKNKARLLKLAKRAKRSWTISEKKKFLTDDGSVDGILVTEVTGKTLIDFWFENGSLCLKLKCYGIGG